MAQHDGVIDNASGAAVRADLNNYLNAAMSNNSGSTTPTTTYPHQWWFDTSTNLLKQRNAANTAWVSVAKKDGAGWQPYYKGANADTVFAKLSGASLASPTLTGTVTISGASTFTGNVDMQADAKVASLYTAGVTGGDKGAGSVNASKYYKDGVEVTPLVAGRTWQDMTAIRATNTTYTNNTPNIITVSLTPDGNTSSGIFYVNGVKAAVSNPDTNTATSIIIDIEPNETYSFDQGFFFWGEKRP